MPTFTRMVGVAPGTTTMQLGASADMMSHAQQLVTQKRSHYMPYGTIEELRASGGLGIINEGDAWLTGRPYGLPGTAVVRLMNPSPSAPYGAQMVGGGFGDADTANIALQLQTISVAQQAAQKALERVAFWQTVAGVTTVVLGVAAVAMSVVKAAQSDR